MNKKGGIFLGVALGIFMFISGVLILPFITDDVTTARVDLNCSNADSITDGTKLTCLFFGGLTPYFIWFFSSLALGLIIGSR